MTSNSQPQYVSTAQVAAALGVSVTTVKRWVDENILPAHRTAGGHRKLLLADVLAFIRQGDYPRLDLTQLYPTGSAAAARLASNVLGAELLTAVREGNAEQISSLVLGSFRAGTPIATLADQVISPTMIRIGQEWETNRLDVLHEHRGLEMLKSALYELKGLLDANATRSRPVAVGGAPEHDPYLLSSLLAQLVLLDNGWEAINLGPHTPMSALRQALHVHRPRLIWLSVSSLRDPTVFAEQYREFYREAERIGVAVAVGGRGLTESLRSTLPYTTYGDGLSHLAAFARSLHPPPSRPRRGRPPRWADSRSPMNTTIDNGNNPSSNGSNSGGNNRTPKSSDH